MTYRKTLKTKATVTEKFKVGDVVINSHLKGKNIYYANLWIIVKLVGNGATVANTLEDGSRAVTWVPLSWLKKYVVKLPD